MWNLDETVDWRRAGSLILVKDSVAAKGTFLLHHLLKSVLGSRTKLPADCGGGKVVLVGLAEPFPHYNRVARKQGCNLTGFRDTGALTFLDFCPHKFLESAVSASSKNPLLNLYAKIRQAVRRHHASSSESVCVVLDDVSILEVASGGSKQQVLDFVHYCRALSSQEQGFSLVLLVHQDLYEESDPLSLVRGLETLSDTVLNAEAASVTGETDIRGLLTVIHRSEKSKIGWPKTQPESKRVQSVRFELRENGVSYTAL